MRFSTFILEKDIKPIPTLHLHHDILQSHLIENKHSILPTDVFPGINLTNLNILHPTTGLLSGDQRHPVLSVFNIHFTRYQSGFYSVFFRISIDIKNCPYSFDNSTIHFHPERMLFITLHFKITFPFQKYPSFISDKSCRKCQFTCRIKIYNCTIGQG